MSARKSILTLGLVTACIGCAVVPATPRGDPASAATSEGTRKVLATSLEDMIRLARADASRVTGMAPDALELASAERVTWSDGSLGCPQPGLLYTQALVPGYRIRLRSPAGVLDYHASLRGTPVLCPADRAVGPLPADGRI